MTWIPKPKPPHVCDLPNQHTVGVQIKAATQDWLCSECGKVWVMKSSYDDREGQLHWWETT